MNDLTILHLSDLHIDDSGKKYSRLLGSLLKDIGEEIKYVRDNSVVVVVTGDILHKGPQYAKSKNAYDHAVQFFTDLRKVLLGKVIGIYIVPGNHDKYRTVENNFLVYAYRSMKDQFSVESSSVSRTEKFGNEFFSKFWKYHLDTYKGRGAVDIFLCVKKYIKFLECQKRK